MKPAPTRKPISTQQRGLRLRSVLVLPILLAMIGVTAIPDCDLDRCSAGDAVDCVSTSRAKPTMASEHCGQKGAAVAPETSRCDGTTETCCGLTQGAVAPALEVFATTSTSPHQLPALETSVRRERLPGHWSALAERAPPDPPRPPLFLLHDALLI